MCLSPRPRRRPSRSRRTDRTVFRDGGPQGPIGGVVGSRLRSAASQRRPTANGDGSRLHPAPSYRPILPDRIATDGLLTAWRSRRTSSTRLPVGYRTPCRGGSATWCGRRGEVPWDEEFHDAPAGLRQVANKMSGSDLEAGA